jgi:hypothetical protein
MTTPPTPPAPPTGTDPPAPPAPSPPAPTPPAPDPPAPTRAELDKLTAALEEERRQRVETKKELDRLKAEGMTEQEKLIAKAREEGKAEAAKDAGLRLVAAEFRAQAAGRIANPDAALAVLDLSKLLGADGEPDKKAIGKLVEQLAVIPAPPGKVPTGPRQGDPNGSGDLFREVLRGR